MAKAVNCLFPVDGQPDNECAMCTSITEGRAMDLIEIDAASNRRIADIRDLTEKIHYGPGEAKYKVYIIDEVHMLTQEAFNALLKTLEEPPPHAILILATTDVQRVPLTIISRCQRFDFRRIPIEAMCEKLTSLCEGEGVEVESNALTLIARKSTGSLRDAENLLDQAIVSFDSPVTEDNLRTLLNMGDESVPAELVKKIAERDLKGSLTLLSELLSGGKEPRQVHSDVIELIRSLILLNVGATSGEDLGESLLEILQELSSSVNLDRLVYLAKIFGSVDFKDSTNQSLPLELAIVESISDPNTNINAITMPAQSYGNGSAVPAATSSPQARPSKKEATSLPMRPVNKPGRQETGRNIPSAKKPRSNPARQKPREPSRTESERDLDAKWNELLRSLRQTGNRFNVGALLRGCMERNIRDDSIVFLFQHSSHVERIEGELDDPIVMSQLKEVVEKTLGKQYEIQIELMGDSARANRKPASQRSHLVRAAQSLGARIVEEREVSRLDE
jgi:DNA polymerase-3 subunit gamma/tau